MSLFLSGEANVQKSSEFVFNIYEKTKTVRTADISATLVHFGKVKRCSVMFIFYLNFQSRIRNFLIFKLFILSADMEEGLYSHLENYAHLNHMQIPVCDSVSFVR